MNKPRMIRTLIIDDEPIARQTIYLLLKDDREIEIIGECVNGIEAVKAVKRQQPDLIFLDIQMPEMNGFDVLEEIGVEEMPAIVFVTAYDQYALRAFEVSALDYLLKPFTDKRFEKALTRAKAQVKERGVKELSQQLITLLENYQDTGKQSRQAKRRGECEYLMRLLIKSAGRVFFLKVDEIDWIEADNYYVQLHVGRRSHLLRETMNELERKLDPGKFLRIHRSTIVNVESVKEMQPHLNGDYLVILHDGTELKLSRSRRERIQSRLKYTRH
jgi:two-component system LytT family response regulator